MMEDHVPTWACKQWGQYEHDWLDCPDCLQAYEEYLDESQKPYAQGVGDENQESKDGHSGRNSS